MDITRFRFIRNWGYFSILHANFVTRCEYFGSTVFLCFPFFIFDSVLYLLFIFFFYKFVIFFRSIPWLIFDNSISIRKRYRGIYISCIDFVMLLHNIGNVNEFYRGTNSKPMLHSRKLSWPALPNGFKRKHVEAVWDRPTDIHNG